MDGKGLDIVEGNSVGRLSLVGYRWRDKRKLAAHSHFRPHTLLTRGTI